MSDPWEMTVCLSGPSAIDAEEVRLALGVLLDPQGHHELRGLPMPGSRVVQSRIASASNMDAAVQAVADISRGIGTYYTLNMVRADLGDRAAKIGDITSRRWILIDCDRSKAEYPDAMATHAEKTAAQELAGRVAAYLIDRGFPLPVIIDSGNGQHLLYLIDLPANEDTRKLVRSFLKALAGMFDVPAGPTIGAECHNASRISKLPGTWVRKGLDTPERPWRMARLMFVPEPLMVAERELINAVAAIASTEEPTPVLGPDPWEMIVQGGQDRITAYVKAAVDRETVKVLLATPGGKPGRNDMLNEAAFALGQFVGAHLLSREDVVRDLTRAAFGCGLDRDPGCGERGIAATIASGLEAGILQPRVIPALKTPERNGKHTGSVVLPPLTGSPIIFAKNVKTIPIEWIWEDQGIPSRKLTTFAGVGGLGKTFVLCDIAARISQGDEWPFSGGVCAERGIVLFISGEDDPDDTLVPRLIELGADLSRIAFLSTEALDRFTLKDINALDNAANHIGKELAFTIIDPPTSYLDGVDDHSNAELRSLLTPLKHWVKRRNCGMTFNTHVNKSQGKIDAMMRVMGSVAWVNAVRSAHIFAKDPNDPSRRLFIPMKTNVGPEHKGLAYRIVKTPTLATVEWLGSVDTTADEAMHQEKKQPRVRDACECLIEMFNTQLEWPGDLFWSHLKENGVTKHGFDQARIKLGVPRSRRTVGADGEATYMFWVAPNWPHLKIFTDLKPES